MENSEQDLQTFKTRLGVPAATMSDAELTRASLILDELADVLFDLWIEQLRNADHDAEDEV